MLCDGLQNLSCQSKSRLREVEVLVDAQWIGSAARESCQHVRLVGHVVSPPPSTSDGALGGSRADNGSTALFALPKAAQMPD